MNNDGNHIHIVISGPQGVGKAILARDIAAYLESRWAPLDVRLIEQDGLGLRSMPRDAPVGTTIPCASVCIETVRA